jgi:hypothetical protein
MAIYELTSDSLRQIAETSFAKAGVKERTDLQRLLRSQIEIVSPGTLVIAEEFGEWEDSRRRIDLLGIDQEANLVVIELKRNEDGEEMDLQAIRYAAMVSTMTFEKALEVYGDYLTGIDSQPNPRESLLSFLGWEEPKEDLFARDVRIILVSADFSKEVTTSVMWLNERDLDIRCIRIKPYSDGGKVLVDVQQIIPLPEVAEYQVRIREKERKQRAGQNQRANISEEEFLADFDAVRTPAEQSVARKLISWAKTHGLRESFGAGKTGSAFIPIVSQGNIQHYPFSLQTQGRVIIQLFGLKNRPPFSDEQKRRELLSRIETFRDFIATDKAIIGFPQFPVTSLTNQSELDRFISILDWIVEEIQAVPAP